MYIYSQYLYIYAICLILKGMWKEPRSSKSLAFPSWGGPDGWDSTGFSPPCVFLWSFFLSEKNNRIFVEWIWNKKKLLPDFCGIFWGWFVCNMLAANVENKTCFYSFDKGLTCHMQLSVAMNQQFFKVSKEQWIAEFSPKFFQIRERGISNQACDQP